MRTSARSPGCPPVPRRAQVGEQRHRPPGLRRRQRPQRVGVGVQVVRSTVVALAPVRPSRGAVVGVDEVGVGDRPGDAGIAAAPGEQRSLQPTEQVDVLGPPRPDRPDGVGAGGVEHGGEAGADLDDLLEHDVGGVETALRAGRGLLSILTTSAGRSGGTCPYASGWPVSGILGITASVVVVAGSVGRRRLVVVATSSWWWSSRGRRRRLGRLGDRAPPCVVGRLAVAAAGGWRRGEAAGEQQGGERSSSAGWWDVVL